MKEIKLRQTRTRYQGGNRNGRIISLTPKALGYLKNKHPLVVADAYGLLIGWYSSRNEYRYFLDYATSQAIHDILGIDRDADYGGFITRVVNESVIDWSRFITTQRDLPQQDASSFTEFADHVESQYQDIIRPWPTL